MTDERILRQLGMDELLRRVEQIRQIQLERLQMVLNRVCRNVSYYHDLFRSMQFLPQDMDTLEALAKLPLTARATLVERQPYGMLAVPPHDVVRIHTALGPDGSPIVVAATVNDIRHWTTLTARALCRVRVTRDDAVYIGLDYGQSMHAFGMHYGAEAIGATVIPRSNIRLSDQLAVMKNYRASVLVCTPSHARQLIHFLVQSNYDAKSLFLRSVILVGEPCSESLRKSIHERLFVNVYSAYGLDEIFSPGIAAETAEQEGLIVNEDHFLAEIVDPQQGTPLPEQQTGELVLTTLTKEALPLIRYRTGELGSLRRTVLQDGRNVLQLNVTGQRTDDLIAIAGAKFYPRQVEQVLSAAWPEALRYNIRIISGAGADRVEVRMEVTERAFHGEMKTLTALKDRIESELYTKFAIPFHLRWMERDALRDEPVVDDQRRKESIE